MHFGAKLSRFYNTVMLSNTSNALWFNDFTIFNDFNWWKHTKPNRVFDDFYMWGARYVLVIAPAPWSIIIEVEETLCPSNQNPFINVTEDAMYILHLGWSHNPKLHMHFSYLKLQSVYTILFKFIKMSQNIHMKVTD